MPIHRNPNKKKPEPEPEVVSDSDSEAEFEVEEHHKTVTKARKDAPKRKNIRAHSDSEEDSEEEAKDSDEDSEEDSDDRESRAKAAKEAKKALEMEKAKEKAVKAEARRRAKQEEAMTREAEKRQKMAEQRAAKNAKANKENAAKASTSGSSRNVCAVPGCNNPKFARGYCSLHIVTAADNEQPPPPQRTRNTLNLWYRRDTPSKGKITWKFVHHGHRHVVIMTFDEFQNKRRVYVDDQEQNPGSRGDDCWYTLCIAGREVRFNVVVMQSFQGEHWRTDLWIDGMSFERGRERWMKHICEKQREELLLLPGYDMARLESETQYLRDHWKREEVQQKTKRGNYKSVVSWHFTIKEGVHAITLEHGTLGGKRKIIVGTGSNSFVHTEKKLGFFESNSSAMYDVEVANVHCRVCIRDLRKCEKRQGLVDDDDPNLNTSTRYQYDLLIEQQPFENCRMSTIQYARMADAHELVRADREVSLTDREMMRVIKMYNIDAMSLNNKHVPAKATQANPQNTQQSAPKAEPKRAPAPDREESDDDEPEVHIQGLNIKH